MDFLGLLVTIAYPIVILLGFSWLYKNKKTLPKKALKGTQVSRIVETVAIGGGSLSIITLLAFYRSYDGIPYALSELAPASVRQEYFLFFGCVTACILIAMIMAWFHRTYIACIGLIICFSATGFLVNSGEVLSYKNHKDEIRKIPLALYVNLNDGIVGADVWFNGMHIGKTPIQADLDEVLAKLPNWDDKPYNEVFGVQGEGERPHAMLTIHVPSQVGMYDDSEDRWRKVYARVELDGELLFSDHYRTVTGGSRMMGQLRPCNITLSMMLPKWNKEIELLLDQARLANYEVDRTWVEAMQSYGQHGWKAIRMEVVKEELGFNQVLDAWAAEVYGIDPDINQTIAQDKFDQICDEANQRGKYHTDSPAGRAVEILVSKLNRDEMITLAEKRIHSERFHAPGGRRSSGPAYGRFDFGMTVQYPKEKSTISPADYVLAHVIWKLDALYDSEDDSTDNPIEERIVALFLRDHNYTNLLDKCQALGGSVFERFVLRHNWRIEPDRMKGNDSFYDSIRVDPEEWNRWQYIAATLDSAAGRNFRKNNESLLLGKSSAGLNNPGFPHVFNLKSLGFLFLDPQLGGESLAAKFWPSFMAKKANAEHEMSEVMKKRWEYLVRMQPNASVEQFVESYQPEPRSRFSADILTQLESELQLEVLSGLVLETERLINEINSDRSITSIRKAERDNYAEMARLVPCEKSAALMIQWLSEQADDRGRRVARIESLINSNRLPDQQLNAIADAEDAELRVLVLPGIEKLPTPTRQAILKKLLSDHDPAVQQQAVKVQEKLEAIRNSPHPSRDN
ncbi:MAG: HEAT repeat domain-containing protein [Planctomycetaceae bacterium]|nr:HEAT repeat domain-containing protein [Planctomycetaceae bacterium]